MGRKVERENPIPSPSPLLSTFAMQTTINYFLLTFHWRPLASTGRTAFLNISAFWADLLKSAENEIFTTLRAYFPVMWMQLSGHLIFAYAHQPKLELIISFLPRETARG